MTAIDTRSDAYKRLSYEVGMFAGVADRLLGRFHFTPITRAQAWALTPEKLATRKAQAEQPGISPATLQSEMEAGLRDHLRTEGEA